MTTPFYEIPRECSPFTIFFYDWETGNELDRIRVEEPGAIHIEGYGRPVKVVVHYANGTVSVTVPDGKGGSITRRIE